MSAPLTEKELGEIRARCEAATAGPWSDLIGDEGFVWIDDDFPEIVAEVCRVDSDADILDNARFIAHSRTDIPALLAHIEYLNARLADQALGCEVDG